MAGLKIIVVPVQRESVQRRHLTPVRFFDPISRKYIETGKASNKNKAKDSVESIGFYENPGTGKYRTGLDEMVVNEFKGQDPVTIKTFRNLSDAWIPILEKVVEQDKISRQMYYEILDGVEPNYYTSVMSQRFIGDMSSLDVKKPRTFIEKFRVTLYDGANVFTADTQRGRFAIQAIKNASFVAPNKESANNNYHNWYIAAENEEELEAVKIYDLENEAIFELTNIQRNYPESKLYELAVTLKDHNNMSLIKGEVAPQIVKDQLNKFIKNKNKHKTENIEKFLKVVEVFKENPQRFEIDYLTAQGLNTGLLFSTGEGHLMWKGKEASSTIYKWKNEDVFKGFMVQESEKYNPNEEGINYYAEFKEELAKKGVPVEVFTKKSKKK